MEAHLPSLAANPRVELVGVADPDATNRAYAARRFGAARAFADAAELLRETRPDGAIVAVPHALHARLGRLVLESGAHLLIEKPMVIDPEDGVDLIQAARTAGREIIVGHAWHFNLQARELRRRLARGEIGEVQSVSCVFASNVLNFYRGDTTADQGEEGYAVAPRPETYADPAVAGGGQGQTQLSHAVALLFFLTGLRATRLAAFTRNLGLAVDVVDAVAGRLDNGAAVTFLTTGALSSRTPSLLEYRLFGPEGYALWDVRRDRARIVTSSGHAVDLDPPPPGRSNPHRAPAEHLVEVVLDGATNLSPPDIGLHTAQFLAAMYRSASSDGSAEPVDDGDNAQVNTAAGDGPAILDHADRRREA